MTTLELEPKDSIGIALRTAPEGPLTLVLGKGTWREKLLVDRPDVTIVSEEGAVIDYDDRHGTVRNGRVFGTGDSASVTVTAPRFSAVGVTFSNSFDWPGAKRWNQEHPDDHMDSQAVAMRLAAGSDKASFRTCTFLGYQDTLYVDAGTSYFDDCIIKGSVDFIFGSGSALFSGCQIISNAPGFLTAPSTRTTEEVGFVFHDCVLKSEGDVPDASVFLARPWHPSGAEDRTCMAVFVDCSSGRHIDPVLWTKMHSRKPNGTQRDWTPEESRFFIFSRERENIGRGEAEKFIRILNERRYS